MSTRRDEARIFQQGQHSLIPVLLREAVLDSVTFRAATKHFEDQVEAVDAWLTATVKQTKDFLNQFCRLEEQALNSQSKTIPTFIESGIIDADFTVTAMSRHSEANRAYWTSIFSNARHAEQTLTEPLLRLQNNEMKEIKNLCNEFHKTQKFYDETLRYYCQQSKNKEASSLREDAFQLFEKRKAYIKSSFDYSIKMSTFRAALDAALISAFSRSFEGTAHHTAALATDFASRPSMSRIMSWSDEMTESSRNAEEHLYTIRFELEDELNRLVSPPRELSEYTLSPQRRSTLKSMPNSSLKPAKQGWLMMRGITGKPARYIWHRKWCYVKEGVFGWLSNNPRTGAVEESDKIGVLLCNVKVPINEERRFCFEVLTKDSTILLQAEHDADVIEWMSTFALAKDKVLEMSQKTNDHAFAVTKPTSEFAAAHLPLEGGPADVQPTESAIAIAGASKRGHSKQDSTSGHGLSALISASNMATNLASPRIVNALGIKVEDQKFYNPFESPVEGNDLAPTTFAPAPINTHLTRETLLDPSSSTIHIPSGTQANHWGSLNYGMLNHNNLEAIQGKGTSKLLAGPEAAVDGVYLQRDRELADRGLSDAVKEYPPEYPVELRRQDAQFCSLFPHARNEHVLMVLRATRSIEDHKPLYSGRIYITLRGLYFYSQSCGMILLQTCLFSEILNVRITRRMHYDELTIDIHDVGEAHSFLYLDNADLARKRIELLLANYIADAPKGFQEMLSILQKTLPDDTNVSGPDKSALKERSVNHQANSSDDEDDEADSRSNKRSAKMDATRLKLPSVPVNTEPDDQMMRKFYDAEYMITAKGLFHLLYGNRSTVWLSNYQAFDVPDVQQGPWQSVEDGTLARAFKYLVKYVDSSGNSKTFEQADYQKISKRVEHLDYTVMHYRRPWQYPYGDTFFLKMKVNIAFVSKTKARIRIWIDIDWQKTNYLSRAILTHAVQSDQAPQGERLTHFIEREVLDRLGLQSKTSKAVRIYGRVGGHSSPIYLEPPHEPRRAAVRQKLSLFDLVRRFPAEFLTSLFMEICLLFLGALAAVWNLVTANGLFLFLLIGSLLFNTWLSGKTYNAYWQHKTAVRLLDNIEIAPYGLMSRAITLQDIDMIAHDTMLPNASGQCFETFSKRHLSNASAKVYHHAYKTSRETLAQTRNDLLVAMKVLNGIETEIVKGEWLTFVRTEQTNCRSALRLDGQQGTAIGEDIREYCEDCNRYPHY